MFLCEKSTKQLSIPSKRISIERVWKSFEISAFPHKCPFTKAIIISCKHSKTNVLLLTTKHKKWVCAVPHFLWRLLWNLDVMAEMNPKNQPAFLLLAGFYCSDQSHCTSVILSWNIRSTSVEHEYFKMVIKQAFMIAAITATHSPCSLPVKLLIIITMSTHSCCIMDEERSSAAGFLLRLESITKHRAKNLK